MWCQSATSPGWHSEHSVRAERPPRGGRASGDAPISGWGRGGDRHVSKLPARDMARAPKPEQIARNVPREFPKSVSYSDGSPGQQDSGAKRDHHNSRPIRFDPKATRRSFRFQGVTGSRAKSRSTAESASPNWLIGHLQHAAENKEHTKPYECHARLPHQ